MTDIEMMEKMAYELRVCTELVFDPSMIEELLAEYEEYKSLNSKK